MIQQNITDRYTEIYVGGGNFLTESFPTHFHTFHTRMILTAANDIGRYREVTAAEREALEKSDAAWSRPPQSFIDLWNSCAESDGRYNEVTGYFELNGLTDITYEEALAIYAHSLQYTYSRISDRNASDSYNTGDCRTYFRIRVYNGHLDFAYNRKLEVLNLKHARLRLLNLYLCPAIRRIIGDPIDTGGGLTAISGAPALEEVRIRLSSGPLDLRTLAMLSPESLLYMATNRYESATEPITVTLHPEAYARLTDDIVAAAAERLITFVTA